MARMIQDDTVCVAVGKKVEESKLTLLWALETLEARNICILHVHQPGQMIFGENSLVNELGGDELRTIKEVERKIMYRILDDYLDICRRAGVNATRLVIEMDFVGEGIVELVYQHSVKKLVMGAAADNHYSVRMMDIKSKKAKYVLQNGPPSCQIWFICRGLLIHTWNENELESNIRPISEEDRDLPSTSNLERVGDDYIYDQLEQALEEAEKSKSEAFEESLRRIRSERNYIEAIRKVRALEILYNEESGCRKEIEEVLARERENAEKMKQEREEERLIALDQKLLMENQVASSEYKRKHLEDELASAQELLRIFKGERDDLEEERDNFLKVTEDLLGKVEDSSADVHQFFYEFSVSEIQEATCDFDPSLKIGEGDYGSIYKGMLRCIPVAIKILRTNSLLGPSEFQLEVNLLSKLRHPNLLTLIGVCPEICALIHEYLPNGSLEDQLNCKGNSPPLSWQIRVRIATELCSALIFLHSSNPPVISHGNLKPTNILLDANYVSKLSDISVCDIQQYRGNASTSRSHRTDLTDTFPYLDPQFFQGEELSPKSDVYSFGVILLQLLTGRSPLSIAQEVQARRDEGNLDTLLDPLAGEWPVRHAKQLVDLALRCCDINSGSQPDLASEVWGALEPIRNSCGFSSSFVHPVEERQAPSYFVCPIMQEVMLDPHVAADGFTYEASALMEWLESGHDTSPMTNLRLTHRTLVPNRALRSAIQDWQEQN